MKLNSYINHLQKLSMFSAALVLGLSLRGVEAVELSITEVADFNDDLGNPTQISPVLQQGTNIIQGAVDGNTFVTDHDYFRVTLPSGSRLAGLTLRITGFSAEIGEFGIFEVLPVEEGNSGELYFMGNTTQAIPFVVGAPDNLILHVAAPFAGLGLESFYNYEVELRLEPVETVAGTAIHRAVEITFPSEAGQSYRLQYTGDVNSDVWSNVGAPIVGVGGDMSAFDTTRDAEQRFYRVVKN
jgi:hypothetical protein